MDRPNRFIAQIYGYSVCLITVVVMFLAISGVIDAAFDLSDPLRSQGAYGQYGPLTSFELYRLQVRKMAFSRNPLGITVVAPTGSTLRNFTDSLSDTDLRKLYDAERENQIGNAKFRSARKLVSGFLLIVLAGVLFTLHWRWLKGINSTPATV